MEATSLLQSVKTYMVFEGLASVLLGLVILLWPGLTVSVVLTLVGIYGIVRGLILFFKGTFAHKGETERALGIVMGMISVLFGLLVLNNPVAFAAFGLIFVAAVVGVQGIYDIASAFTLNSTTGHRVLVFIAGALALLFTVWTVTNPAAGGLFLVLYLAVTLIFAGSATIVVGSSIKLK